jgi:hypothetical protein
LISNVILIIFNLAYVVRNFYSESENVSRKFIIQTSMTLLVPKCEKNHELFRITSNFGIPCALVLNEKLYDRPRKGINLSPVLKSPSSHMIRRPEDPPQTVVFIARKRFLYRKRKEVARKTKTQMDG